MPTEYTNLVQALKSLTQGEAPDTVILPMAENGWNTRPECRSYGMVSLDFEADSMAGDGIKLATAYEGSVDLLSRAKDGDGWIRKITDTLTEHCGASWKLNSHQYERENRIFHWEWIFEVEDTVEETAEEPTPPEDPIEEPQTEPEDPVEEPPTEGDEP